MPKTRKLTFACPATVEDRAVKSGNLKLGIDPSTEGFLLKSKAREQMLSMQLVPGKDHRGIKPIPLAGITPLGISSSPHGSPLATMCTWVTA